MTTRLPVRVKVAVVTAALTFLILCAFAVVIGAVAEQRIRAGFDDDLRATVADLANRLDPRPGPDGRVFPDPDALVGAEAGGALVRLVQRGGEVIYPPGGLGPLAEPGFEGLTDFGDYRVAARALTISNRDVRDRFDDPLTSESVATVVGYVQYAKPKSTVATTINRVRLFLALGVLGGTLLAFLGGLVVAQRAMRPIAGLTRAAREVARTRDPDVTLPKPRANDEVSDLAHTLENMLSELGTARGETEATLARQREFVADASHELRTPLTSILANLELLESELQGEQREMADSALRSSRRMRRLIADLLLLARADAGRQAQAAPVDLVAVTREAAAEAGALSSEHPLSLDLPAAATVNGVADELHRLAANLIENALLHTPAGTPVTVSVRSEGDSAVLEVADRGPGVPSELRQRVFERFASGAGDSGSARSGGTGLGLAIVKAVADSHGGRVELLEAEGGGARFLIALPAGGEKPLRSDPAATVFGSREA
ncbi:MAG: sensor histidine kinase [Thermoleophilaceae bacterium]